MIKRQGVCLISYGETPFVRPKGEDKPALQYLADAMKQALDRVHLGKTDIGGFAFSSTTLGDEAEPVAEHLGLELAPTHGLTNCWGVGRDDIKTHKTREVFRECTQRSLHNPVGNPPRW